jgi:hypothetical protein
MARTVWRVDGVVQRGRQVKTRELGCNLNISHLFSSTSTENTDKSIVFFNIYRHSRGQYFCHLFS